MLTGRVIYNPWTEKIFDFPTFMQYRSWVQSPNEGRPVDESITFVSLDKIPVNVDVSVAYQFQAREVPELFIKFRSDPDIIADTYIRSRVRDAFVRSGSGLKAMDILGGGIGKLDSDVVEIVDQEMAPIGIRFDYVSVLNRPRIPEAIQDAINRVIESTQRAQQAQNQIAVVKAEAEQKVAAANGEANATRARAQGEADALLMRATRGSQSESITRHQHHAGIGALAADQAMEGQRAGIHGRPDAYSVHGLRLNAAIVGQTNSTATKEDLQEASRSAPRAIAFSHQRYSSPQSPIAAIRSRDFASTSSSCA